MMTMRKAIEKLQASAEKDESISATYMWSSFNGDPCRIYLANRGSFSGTTWEECFKQFKGVKSPLPDEDPV